MEDKVKERVYEYAKKEGVPTKEIVAKLEKHGIKKGNLSYLDEKEIQILEKELKKNTENMANKKENTKDTVVIKEKLTFNNDKKKEVKNDSPKKFKNIYKDRLNLKKEDNDSSKDNKEKSFKDNKFKNKDNKKEFNNNKKDFKHKTNNNNSTDKQDKKDFRKNNSGNNPKFNKFDKDKDEKDSVKNFNKPKPKKEVSSEAPIEQTKKSNKSSKSKFDKKKYENEKRAKEEERKLKELRTDYRKENVKKKIKKKDKEISKVEVIKDADGSGVLNVNGEMTIKELAEKLGINVSDIIKKFFMEGKMYTANAILTLEEIEAIALDNNVLINVEEEKEMSYGEKYELEIEDKESDLELRAPVITIMGHVDHGKTSLLDALRHSNVTSQEAGGITQSIGAYQIEWKGQKITFIDTPGHEAFTEMRVRGANITDIAILIVAADDGVKPQTIEAISHAKEANVPIIVAINKIDKPGANPTRVKQELMEHGLIAQEWGGDIECVEISAKQKLNLDELLETILITAELLELKANPKKRAKAVVIESRLDPQIGAIADILIKEGELKVGDIFVCGEAYGKIRTMTDDKGNRIQKAYPSQPVEVTGFDNVPEAGDMLYCVQNDKQARKIIEDYRNTIRENEIYGKKYISLESLSKELEGQQLKELKCIIRADSKGSVEALKESLNKLSNDKVVINVIQASAGAITEGDIKLAEASNAIIIGFGVRPNTSARNEAEKIGVEIRNYNVIYHVTEDIQKAMNGLLDPEFKEVYNGRLEVIQVFKISNVGNIAGAMVVDGKIYRNSKIRVLREGIIIYEGDISSLKRYKDDVKEANIGQDCGISIKDFNDIKVGDVLEAFKLEEITR